MQSTYNYFFIRAWQAKQFGNVHSSVPTQVVSNKIRNGAFGRMFILAGLIATYICTVTGHLSTTHAGIITLAALPFMVYAIHSAWLGSHHNKRNFFLAVALFAQTQIGIYAIIYQWNVVGITIFSASFLLDSALLISGNQLKYIQSLQEAIRANPETPPALPESMRTLLEWGYSL